MDTNNLNSEIKRLFFQLLATGNKYVNHVYDGAIKYYFKIDDTQYCHTIHFFKSYNYVANENEASNKINKLGIPTHNPNTLYLPKGCDCDCDCKSVAINNDNIKVSFTVNIDKLGSFPIIDLTEDEYAQAMRIITNVCKEFKIKQLEILDEITENALDDLSDGI